MINNLGTSSFLQRESTFSPFRPPHYEDTFVGSQSDVNFSASAYANAGWTTTIRAGNPYTLTATIDSDIDGHNLPIITGSSYVTTTFGFHFNTAEKELLHVSVNGLNNGSATWLNNIIQQDKNALEYYIANPPAKAFYIYDIPTGTTSSISVPVTMSWDSSHGFSSNSTSILASQVVWSMTRQGQKTIPLVTPVLRMTQTVPSNFAITYFTSNINRIHAASTVQAQIGVPTNYYNAMLQVDNTSDPSSGTVVADGTTTNIPLIYGWKKLAPSIDSVGLNITITQDWEYGLWFQNVWGTRI